MRTRKVKLTAFWFFVYLSTNLLGQTTAFNYQGRLTDGGSPANGSFQMQFKLFDSVAAGNQVGPTLTDVPITASQGVFSTKLDFGAGILSGANRWLEIAVRRNSGESYVALSPREQIASSPYAVQTLNAQMLGGISASEYVTTSSVGSSFIRNSASPQQVGNFNISGSGFFGSSVGIGTTSPSQQFHLRSPAGANAASLVQAPGGFFAQYQLQSGSDNSWIIGAQDNFSNGALLFRNGATDLMTIRQTGNVGIGTNSPVGKLQIEGGGLTGLSLLTTGPVSIGGYVTQPRDKGGISKAMVFINGDGSMIRCYNGVTGSSTGNCGILSSHSTISPGRYIIQYPFQIDDRFWVGNVIDAQGGYLFSVALGLASTIILVVEVRDATNNLTDRPFMLVVY